MGSESVDGEKAEFNVNKADLMALILARSVDEFEYSRAEAQKRSKSPQASNMAGKSLHPVRVLVVFPMSGSEPRHNLLLNHGPCGCQTTIQW